jgi:hypothetical protein
MHSRELPLVGNAKKRSKKKKKTRWVGAFRWFLHMYVGVDFFFFRRPSLVQREWVWLRSERRLDEPVTSAPANATEQGRAAPRLRLYATKASWS